ncbi:filamentous hemagglutinin N-terminal domain-containing protein [Cyanobacteria bacterium FACHB-471]|nr:filamentous hemagglutinin N-terminal domain-containing protein [Cyanobacteria bacterium FACHB-471]
MSAVFCALPIAAQVVPDDTLPAGERSQVIGDVNAQIDGGARRGGNLFHSFQSFSVPTGGSAYFNNAADVQNIFSRVTGRSASNIDGLIRANGTANLFLLNPNGILFGPNATLNIGGSFVASTASSIHFANDLEFSAIDPSAPPLLTINTPIGLQFGTNPGAIQVQGAELAVPTGETLALAGGNISIRGGTSGASGEPNLTAPGGRIELGSVARNNQVSLTTVNTGYQLGYEGVGQFLDVVIADSARINVAADGGGDIAINARNLDILAGSLLEAGIASNLGSEDTQAGDISINATGAIALRQLSWINNEVFPNATGRSGDINIRANSLEISEFGQISNSIFGRGQSGDINVSIIDNITVTGSDTPSGITGVKADLTGIGANVAPGGVGNTGDINIEAGGLVSLTNGSQGRTLFVSVILFGAGQGGDINLQAQSLFLRDGAYFITTTSGIGDAGNISVDVRDSVVISGVSSQGFSSALNSNASAVGQGEGGAIEVRARNLYMRNGGVVAARSLNAFNSGDIVVNVDNLELTGGSQILTTAFQSGLAGSIRVDAANITISGSDPTFAARLAQFGRPAVDPASAESGIFANTDTNSISQGGSIRLRTEELIIQNGGRITVNSQGSGDAGSVEVIANSIRLGNGGTFSAETASGRGGNITLQNVDVLVLRNGSMISSTAGTAQSGGDGGNITFNGNFIVSAPNENNDIIANAFEGSGGQITLSAQGIYGFAVQTREDLQRLLNTTDSEELTPRNLLTNDITAFSQENPTIDAGTVTVQTPDLDPTQGLIELPTELSDPSQLIATVCPAGEGSSFAITGRGGLRPSPEQQLDDNVSWRDRRRLVVPQQVDSGSGGEGDAVTRGQEESVTNALRVSASPLQARPSSLSPASITEATGWQTTPTGEVVLVADTSNPVVQNSLNQAIACYER